MEEEHQAADTVEGEFRSNPPRALAYRELIDESLYEFYAPSKGTRPEVQVVFFHGVEREYSKRAYVDTWKSSNGTELWPTWLAEKFPTIRLLSVSYDCSAVRSPKKGNMDLYRTAENVIQDLVGGDEGVGKYDNCPLVLVGKDLGCLVIQAVCLMAKDRTETSFLNNLKCFVFYCPPFMGTSESSIKFSGELAMKLKGGDNEVSRNHHRFSKLQKQQNWVAWVMVAANIAGNGELLKDIPEASSRFGDEFYTAPEDISTICRPHSPTSISFLFLKNLIIGCLKSNCTVHECQGLPTHSVGLMKNARKLEDSLKGTSMVVGITGMGGVGKTTLAKQLFNNISWKFEYTCFVEEVKQHTLLDNLEYHMKRGFHRFGKAVQSIQWNDLQQKKTLVIMDDVDSEQQLRHLPSMKRMGEGSIVIITTRNQRVLRFFDPYVHYNLECLGVEDAKKLFCQYAFNEEKMPESLSLEVGAHVEEVIKKCDGLPLTLEVLGRYFKGHENDTDLRVWTETIEKLGRADSFDGDENDQVWRKLRVSYDTLEPVVKEMFLDVATFFFKETVESALTTWETGYGYPVTGWMHLVDRGLVKSVQILDRDLERHSLQPFKHRHKIWMHEHFRDLGERLSLEDRLFTFNKKPNTRIQIQLPIKEGDECIPRQYRLYKQSFDIPEAHLKHLKYLVLEWVRCEGGGQIAANNLHFLRWQGLYLDYATQFPFKLEEMKRLSVLKVDSANFDQGQPLRLPSGLRSLQLRRIRGLDRLPDDFGTLALLEGLVLAVDLTTLPENFGALRSLMELSLKCPQLESLPESLGQLKSLKYLRLDLEKLCFLPENFGRLTTVTHCTLLVPNLQSLPERFHLLAALTNLMIQSTELKRLPNSFGQLPNLKTMWLSTPNLQSLPERFDLLRALGQLAITAERLERLPDTFGQLSALKKLTLWTPELQSLPERFDLLTALGELKIYSGRLERLPDTFDELSALTKLTLRFPKLQSLPERVHLLTALGELEINSGRLERLPDTFDELSALRKLTLRFPKLQSLPERFDLLTALDLLHIASERLERLPGTFGQLSALKKLTLWTPELQSLPERFDLLTALGELKIVSERLERLPDTFGQLSALTKLEMWAPKLQSLPERFHLLTALHELEITSEQLERLPDTFGQLSALEKLTLKTPKLSSLPDEFHRRFKSSNISRPGTKRWIVM